MLVTSLGKHFPPLTIEQQMIQSASSAGASQRPLLFAGYHIHSPLVGESLSYSVLIGNRKWMRKNGHHVEAHLDAVMASHEDKGQTVLLVAIDGDVT